MSRVPWALEKWGLFKLRDMFVELTGSFFVSPHKTGIIYNLSQVHLLSPCQPSKIVCVGLNYPTGEEAKISPDPLLFMKPTSSIIGPGEKIVQWPEVKELTFEAELAVVIGQRRLTNTVISLPE